MSNEKNINTNVEKKDATVVAHEIKGELTYEDKVILFFIFYLKKALFYFS